MTAPVNPVAPPEVRQLRVPPNSRYDERAVLGSCLIDGTVLADTADALVPTDFYGEAHRAIFTAMVALSRRNTPVDVLTLEAEMRAAGKIEAVGGITYLNELLDTMPTVLNTMHYVELVKRYSTLRAIIGIATEAVVEGYTEPADAQDFIASVIARLSRVETVRMRGVERMSSVAELVAQDIRAAQDAGQCTTAIPSGFDAIDAHMVGLHAGELTIVCGRPGTGKTVMMLQMAQAAARAMPGWALIASLEMSAKALVLRALSSAAGTTTRDLRGGRLSPAMETSVLRHLGRLSQDRIAFVSGTQTVSRIRAAARKQKADGGLTAVFVDYLGLLKAETRGERRDIEVGNMTRDLKLMATELECPVVCLVQLNRESERNAGDRPKMHHLRDSGRIEEDADVIMGLYRDRAAAPTVLECEVLKGRSCGEAKIELGFDPAHTRILQSPPASAVRLDAPDTWHDLERA